MTLGGFDSVPDVVPPVSIDAILEEDDSEESDVARQVLGQESSLEKQTHAPPRLVLVSRSGGARGRPRWWISYL